MSRSIILSVRTNKDIVNKISAIKGVRNLTGMGLKESKDLVETLRPGISKTLIINHDVLEPGFSESLKYIQTGGITTQVVVENAVVRTGIADKIRSLVTFSTIAGQYDIAKALIDIVETYCPEINETEEDESNSI